MPSDIVQILQDAGIVLVEHGHKHCRPGWIQTECPFCSGNRGYHLGYNIDGGFFVCWRCGWHSTNEVLETLLRQGHSQVKKLLGENKKRPEIRISREKPRPKNIKVPGGPLQPQHEKYLLSRNFDPEKIVRAYNISGTGFTGDYKFRIIIPIFFDNEIVSYQGRDITGKQTAKYKACAESNEILPHKSILYGLDACSQDAVVVVEGALDVWRLGPGSCATFGIKSRVPQIKLLAERFKQIFLLFDTDENVDSPESAIQAENICSTLSSLGKRVEKICLTGGDPADLSEVDAKHLMQELGF